MPRTGLRCIRPEEEQKLVAAAPLFTGSGENGKQRKPTFLLRVLSEQTLVIAPLQTQGSESSKTEGAHAREPRLRSL